jgi:hypothetical protein
MPLSKTMFLLNMSRNLRVSFATAAHTIEGLRLSEMVTLEAENYIICPVDMQLLLLLLLLIIIIIIVKHKYQYYRLILLMIKSRKL